MFRGFAEQAFPSKGRTAPGTTPSVMVVLASACPDGNHNHRTKIGSRGRVANMSLVPIVLNPLLTLPVDEGLTGDG